MERKSSPYRARMDLLLIQTHEYPYYVRAREEVDLGESDAFFLQPGGSPFTSKATLADFMTDTIQPVFPWFQPKMMRPWCATARLIDSGYDYVAVANWLDHDSVEKLGKHYDRHAHLAERRYGENWLIRIARRPAKPKEPQAADRRRSKRRPNSGVSLHFNRKKIEWSHPGLNRNTSFERHRMHPG